MLLRTTPVSSPNPKALVVVSKSMRAVKLCTNKILHNGCKTVVVVVVMLVASIVKSIKRQSGVCLCVLWLLWHRHIVLRWENQASSALMTMH